MDCLSSVSLALASAESVASAGTGGEERPEESAASSRNSRILASASESENQTVPSSAGLAAWLVSSVA